MNIFTPSRKHMLSFKTISVKAHEEFISQRAHCLYNKYNRKSEKPLLDKHENTTCISSLHPKHIIMQSFETIGATR